MYCPYSLWSCDVIFSRIVGNIPFQFQKMIATSRWVSGGLVTNQSELLDQRGICNQVFVDRFEQQVTALS